jgi:hypothetical protein
MTTLYKLTRPDLTTHNGFTYTPGVWTPEVSGNGDLCGPGWYHAYTHPGLALLLNPIHANYAPCRLWEAEGEIGLTDRGLKVGVRRLRLTHELVAPSSITAEQCITFALHAALAVCFEPTFVAWAEGWLAGTDRSEKTARAAAEAAAEAVARVALAEAAAAWAAARAAARAAEAAAAWAWAEAAEVVAARAATRAARAAAEAAADVAETTAAWAAARAAADVAAVQLVAWADAALVGVTWERKVITHD